MAESPAPRLDARRYARRYDAAQLLRDAPPRWSHAGKKLVAAITCPAGATHRGTVQVSRWSARELPAQVDLASPSLAATVREGFFSYDEPDGPAHLQWHMNFAHTDAFHFYAGSLLAQDELQVVEHPALASVREALLAEGLSTRTVEAGRATPLLVRGVERRCWLRTDPDAAADRPRGLYGSLFAHASEEAIRRAVRPIVPPTTSHVVAIAAPSNGHGAYRVDTLREILDTALAGFAAVRDDTRQALGADARASLHTGYWGCGAFGGNRTLMVLLQLLAAEMAKLDALVIHTGAPGSDDDAREALALRAGLGTKLGDGVPFDELLGAIAALGFEWGEGDGS